MDGHPFGVSRRVTYLSASSPARPAASASKTKRLNDPWVHQKEGQVADLKRRIPILKRLIADCDRLAADLNQEVRNEEDRVKIHDLVHSAYSTYARATALRRDNLRRSADELGAHLAKAEKALLEFGVSTLSAWTQDLAETKGGPPANRLKSPVMAAAPPGHLQPLKQQEADYAYGVAALHRQVKAERTALSRPQ
jgi:flagellar protein FliJ